MTDDEINDKIEPYLRHMPVVITMGWMEEMMRAFYRDHVLCKAAEPFGYWHQGETEEESDFFKTSESGHVGCTNCVALFTRPAIAKATGST